MSNGGIVNAISPGAKEIGSWIFNILILITTAAVGWYLQDLNTKLAKMQDDMSEQKVISTGTQRDVQWIKETSPHAYTKKEVDRMNNQIYQTDKDQYDRLDKLNNRQQTLRERVSRLEGLMPPAKRRQ